MAFVLYLAIAAAIFAAGYAVGFARGRDHFEDPRQIKDLS